MQATHIINSSPAAAFSLKEAGPIIVALGFIIALGGVSAAAIVICGWGHVKSAGINWSRWTAEIVCR